MSDRRNYKSLDEFAATEGVIAVLEFLARNPTIVGGEYRHTKIPVVPFTVERYVDPVPHRRYVRSAETEVSFAVEK